MTFDFNKWLEEGPIKLTRGVGDPELRIMRCLKWRSVNGYGGIYVVSESGHLINVKSRRLLSLKVDRKNYRIARLYGPEGMKSTGVHRLVCDSFNTSVKSLIVDHIDGDVTNNHYTNLRACTKSENTQHRTKFNSNNSSGHPGITWHKNKRKWQAQIKSNYNYKCLGLFDDINDAIMARKRAEKGLFGEYMPVEMACSVSDLNRCVQRPASV